MRNITITFTNNDTISEFTTLGLRFGLICVDMRMELRSTDPQQTNCLLLRILPCGCLRALPRRQLVFFVPEYEGTFPKTLCFVLQ